MKITGLFMQRQGLLRLKLFSDRFFQFPANEKVTGNYKENPQDEDRIVVFAHPVSHTANAKNTQKNDNSLLPLWSHA